MTDPPARRFDAVLFDFGGVFVPSPFEVLTDAAAEFGVSPQVLLETCFGSYAEDTDHPWHRLERGEVIVEDALAAISRLAAESGHDWDPIQILTAGMGDELLVRDDVVELTRLARSLGLSTAILTNNIKEFGAKWRELLPLEELFDLVVDSSEVGMRKPDPRIFRLTLERLGVAAEHAIFLDDAPGNVAAARAVGIHAIEVPFDHASAVAELRGLIAA